MSLTIVKNNKSYAVPLDIEAKGGAAIDMWIAEQEAAEAVEQEVAEPVEPEQVEKSTPRKRRSTTQEG